VHYILYVVILTWVVCRRMALYVEVVEDELQACPRHRWTATLLCSQEDDTIAARGGACLWQTQKLHEGRSVDEWAIGVWGGANRAQQHFNELYILNGKCVYISMCSC
jgi:hypothetical protein